MKPGFVCLALASVFALVSSLAEGQTILLRCNPPERTDTIEINLQTQVVSLCLGGAPPCIAFAARIDERYVSFGPLSLSGGGCTNCSPMVVDRATGVIRWADNSVGQCTRAQGTVF